jgi:hypothetical protein
MATIITLVTGETLAPTTYAKVCSDRYSIFLAGGEHRMIPVSDVIAIDKTETPRKPSVLDLPVTRWAWEGDAKDLRA